MARLIDADALMKFPIRINHYDKEHGNEDFVLGIESVLEYAENLPTVDAVEVVHGRWEYNTDDFTPAYRCSVCGYNKPMIAGEGVSQGAMNYCPNCGSKMDLEVE